MPEKMIDSALIAWLSALSAERRMLIGKSLLDDLSSHNKLKKALDCGGFSQNGYDDYTSYYHT
jgi:hypothetical protein